MTVDLPMALAVPIAAVLGLVIGSFLNVVTWRLPRGESVVRPPSACPVCGAWVRPWDDVPVVSWLVLRGRCRDCDATISPRYPAVEAMTGVLFVLVVVRFGGGTDPQPWAIPAYLYLAAIGVTLSFIDLDTHRLPDPIVLPALIVAPLLLTVASAATGDWIALSRALAGGAILCGAYFAMLIAYPAGMGFGDVKLAAVLGMYLGWVGWGALFVGGFAAFVFGGVFSVALLLSGRAGRKSGIPFGPWMIIGTCVGVGWGQQAWDAYLGLMS
jgi:leader peptidase (prepilin peptidase) / N-methyltransferase